MYLNEDSRLLIPLNRLLSVSEPGGTTAYVYDGDGTRVKKTQGSVITKYINDVGLGLVQVLLETTDAGIIQAAYTYGNDLISMNRSSVNSYYHYDGLGSARQLTDSSEAAVANYIYDAFGNSVASVSSVANTYGFTGEQQFNEADSLVFLRARYYSPNIGRFISRDPIGYRDGLNLYAYCKHNPINFTDPEGKAVNPHTIACAICAFMFGKDIAGLITDCLNAGNDCNGNKKSFWDCIKDNWHKAFIPESKWEKMLKSTSCGICFLGYKPFPIPGKPIPIPVPASAGF